MFGEMPAYGFFIRHVKNLEMNNVEVSYLNEDVRPPFVLNDVKGADFYRLKAQRAANIPTFVLSEVEDLSVQQSASLPNTRLDNIKRGKL